MRLKTGGCFAEEYANNENNGKGAVTQTKKSFVRQPLFLCDINGHNGVPIDGNERYAVKREHSTMKNV